MPPELDRILRQTPELQNAWLVGGCVRDALLGCPGKDFDVEVFGLGCESLARALARWGKVDLVGQSFGVVKLTTGAGWSYDFTVPRRDSMNSCAPPHGRNSSPSSMPCRVRHRGWHSLDPTPHPLVGWARRLTGSAGREALIWDRSSERPTAASAAD